MIGRVETGRKLLEQVIQARIPVRLADRDQRALALHRAARLQNGGDLDRVVAVIVDDLHRRLARDRNPISDRREAPLHPAELRQCAAHLNVCGAKLQRHGDGRQRVLHIVLARHRQREILDQAYIGAGRAPDLDIEMRAVQVSAQVGRPHIGLQVEAVGDAAPVGDARRQCLHLRMVRAQNGEAVERQVLDKGVEGFAQPVHGAVMVHVLGVDIGDDGAGRMQLGKGAVALVALDDHPVAFARLVVRAIGMDDPAIDDGRVNPRPVQQAGDQRGRRRLAMRARDADGVFQPRDLGEHVGAPHDGNARGAGSAHFRIVALDRGRDDHSSGACHVLWLVADEHLHAACAQALDIGTVGDVRALHLVAHRQHDIRNAGHADAANADNMRGAYRERGGW